MDARGKPAHDAAYIAAPYEDFSDSNFKQPRVCVLAPPREVELLVCLPFVRGSGAPKGAIVTSRGLSPGSPGNSITRQRLFGAPPRRLKTLVRSSGDVATLGDFAPHACPRPASLSGRAL